MEKENKAPGTGNGLSIFADNFEYFLKNSGKSIYVVEKETGIAHSHLYAIRNKQKSPSMKMQEKIAQYFGVEIGEFFKQRNK